jgi:hypothetical protein
VLFEDVRNTEPSGIDPARVKGIESVLSNTPPDWANTFDTELARLAETGNEFSVYDVLAAAGRPPEEVHPSAIGARMRVASNKGVIRKSGFAERASHGDVVAMWVGA